MFWKIPIEIPKGIRYISQWNEFKLSNYTGHNILHKQLPGCGMTEYILTCPFPTVLCSPRKMLMQNKKEQHGDDVYLVVSEFDRELGVDEDLSKPLSPLAVQKQMKEEGEKITEEFKKILCKEEDSFYKTLFHEIQDYINSLIPGKFPKIIVTYDSSYLVRRILEQMGFLQDFWFIVDEFQSLLEDARFKAETENNFLTTVLPSIPNVLYVSATPMLDKYIERIPELQVPYYEMDWEKKDPGRVKKPDLKVRTMKSVSGKMEEVIKSYLKGDFERVIVDRGGRLEEVVSTECVIYVNSVNHIISIIKKIGLTPDQVNILCSNTPENQKRIDKKLGVKTYKYNIGKVPLRGEPHKMFTFCTRTVYLGADFYSLCARSFIFSDSNSDSLSVDISMDLAQILGRQRLLENPWHNSAEFYYKATADYKKMTWEDFKKLINVKLEKTNSKLTLWRKGNPKEREDNSIDLLYITKSLKYKNDYVGVNRLEDGTLVPTINNLVILNEERSFDIQQIDYANRFSVFCSIEREFGKSDNLIENMAQSFFLQYDQVESYIDKCKTICEYLIEYPEMFNAIINNLSDHDKIKQQLITIGPERMKGLGYNITRIKQAMGIVIFDRETLDSIIYSTFIVGNRYSNSFIKETLKSIYDSADLKETPKANQLESWFDIKPCKLTIDGKRENGFEIIKKK